MITGKDIYNVVAGIVPLYVAMFLGYGSVRWWNILTPEQCSGVNRFVSMFAAPFLAFQFIMANNPYEMNLKFLAGDTLQKVLVMVALYIWNLTRFGNLDTSIIIYALFALPNTLVMGIPLLEAMYGKFSTSLMTQIVVLQSVIWNTVLLILLEYRAGKILIQEKFPDNAAAISTVTVDPEVESLGGEMLQADADTGYDGRLRVDVRRSPSISSSNSSTYKSCNNLPSSASSRASSHREINSFHSARETPLRNPSFGGSSSPHIINLQNSLSNGAMLEEDLRRPKRWWWGGSSKNNSRISSIYYTNDIVGSSNVVDVPHQSASSRDEHDELNEIKENSRYSHNGSRKKMENIEKNGENKKKQMPSASVMTKLIIVMVYRKLAWNPNTWASFVGIAWSLIQYRFHLKMPSIIEGSITIVSNTGLGMAMFSLGLFMALQPNIIACGKKWAAISLGVRFLGAPAVIAATSAPIGIRGDLLRVEIIQASLPQGIMPFVFAKEYNLYPDIFSTAVIFGMVVALPVTIVYYVLLGLFN
ncbi:protein that induces appearance of [PIN+] prion when overproduced [Stylosanthes scabra]|uniref:Auxin efflux carrier component n=1 Tax=Stylosanthes scabra TaxID=79078 RepID=A0ABU6U2X4_9FABA|nr:protein that induces appearance of [PIN+] prion when overproduced [Stylosanthes scabra]